MLVFSYSTEQESIRIQALFKHRVERVQEAIEREMLTHKHIAENMKAYFDASDYVSATGFQVVAGSNLQHHPDIIAIEWIPRVLDQPDLPISVGNIARFPIKYIEPLQGNERALGYDISQNKLALKTVLQATRTGEASFPD